MYFASLNQLVTITNNKIDQLLEKYFNKHTTKTQKTQIQNLIQKLKKYKENQKENAFSNILEEVDQLIIDNQQNSDQQDTIDDDIVVHQSIYSDYSNELFNDRKSKYINQQTYEIKSKYSISRRTYNSLLQYQKYGFKFILSQYYKSQEEQGGCILADEAGLGKTIQAISAIEAIMSDINIKRITIVAAPISVINQWVQEFRQWSPINRVLIISQDAAKYNNLKTVDELIKYLGKDASLLYGSVLLMSHNILQQHAIQLCQIITKLKPLIVLDEFHLYKNPETLKHQALTYFTNPFILGLTGTPIQNNYQEIYNLFNLVNSRILGNKQTFEEEFVTPICKGVTKNATISQINVAITQARQLINKLSTIMLRRYKVDVISNLPQRSEFYVWCKPFDMATKQYMKIKANRNTFNDVLEYYNRLQKALIYNGRTYIFQDLKMYFLFSKISELYNIKIDYQRIYYDRKDYQGETQQNMIDSDDYSFDEDVEEEQEIENDQESIQNIIDIKKLDITQPKCIIFCHNLYYIEILQQMLNQIKQLKYRVLTGQTSIKKRQIIIDEFNYNQNVQILLSTGKVGGIGLNLTAANNIFLMQPHFNPSIDEQSIQRSYRIGQKREVYIYRIMYKDTIEEKIFRAAQTKIVLQKKALQNALESVKSHITDNYDTGRCKWPEQWGTDGIKVEKVQYDIQNRDQDKTKHTDVKELGEELLDNIHGSQFKENIMF